MHITTHSQTYPDKLRGTHPNNTQRAGYMNWLDWSEYKVEFNWLIFPLFFFLPNQIILNAMIYKLQKIFFDLIGLRYLIFNIYFHSMFHYLCKYKQDFQYSVFKLNSNLPEYKNDNV